MRRAQTEGILRIGISRYEDYKDRTINIAKGKRKHGLTEPTLWFESLQSLGQVLSEENWELLGLIREKRPESIAALSRISGRSSSHLSRTLYRLADYGIVDMERVKNRLVPKVRFKIIEIQFGLPDSRH